MQFKLPTGADLISNVIHLTDTILKKEREKETI